MLRIGNLTKIFHAERGIVRAVDDVSFEVSEGKFFTLLGPSGCGKTTTLRCVAGLERPDSGEIHIGAQEVCSSQKNLFVPPNKRDIGMVFQSYAIWPHMNVFDNVAFPLAEKRMKRAEIKETVQDILRLVKLDGMEDRPAPLLSGGQQQRLALARALVKSPGLILLDEPLSNLDARLRQEMRVELKELLRKFNITSLYVTHDQIEALAMSDDVAVMNEGKIIQIAPPTAIYHQPANKFVAEFMGAANFFVGEAVTDGNPESLGQVETAHGIWQSFLPPGMRRGDRLMVCIRPENFTMTREKPHMNVNSVEGIIEQATFLGEAYECVVIAGKDEVRTRAHHSLVPQRKEKVFLWVNPELCTVIKWE